MTTLKFMEKGIESLLIARGFFQAAGEDMAAEHIDFLVADARLNMSDFIEANFKQATMERKI